MSQGEKVDLRVNGKRVYSTEKSCPDTNFEIGNLDGAVLKYFLRIATSAFGHADRFRIIKHLAESPKSFSEIKKMLEAQSPTVNFHLKTLVDKTLVLKDENGRYTLSLMGELVLDYFADFIKEANCLNDVLVQKRDGIRK